jgi:hypothetical protein
MIRTVFIIQVGCLASLFINVGITGANSYSELGIAGKAACIMILSGFGIQLVITGVGFFKKK